MKRFTIFLIIILICLSCNRIMVREYESPLDPYFFKNAECVKTSEGSYFYTLENISFELNNNDLKKFVNQNPVWKKNRNDVLYPFNYLDLSVPYLIRDGMSSNEILEILGPPKSNNKRFNYYKLNNGSELVLFKGTLNMPQGMKSLIIQGLDYKDDIRIPLLK